MHHKTALTLWFSVCAFALLGLSARAFADNACDAAVKQQLTAALALLDVLTDKEDAPVVLSRGITGAPTLETLRAELDEARLAVSLACRQGPTR